MPAPSLASLLIAETKEALYALALSIAQTIGLNTTAWFPGDPTRSLFFVETEMLEGLESEAASYVNSGFLDYAAALAKSTGNSGWLNILAKQVYNVDVPAATYAETPLVLTNAGGGVYDLDPGDVTFKASITGATYHNTTGGHLAGSGGTLTVTVVADEAGAASTAGATEIDTLVTNLLGVTCSNPTAAVGLDEQSPDTTVQQCRAKLGSLSPNGPASAYDYVALNQTLTGIQTVTRSRTYPDSDTGDVTVYVAGPSGLVSGGDVAAVQAAIQQWATPLCITPTVLSANAVTVNVTYTLWIYQSANLTTTQTKAIVQTALENFFETRPIGGDITPPATTGALYASLVEAVIGSAVPGKIFRVSLSAPAFDITAANGDVFELGTVTGTVNIVPGQ